MGVEASSLGKLSHAEAGEIVDAWFQGQRVTGLRKPLVDGQRVLAKWRCGRQYYHGRVSGSVASDGSYCIEYDSGDVWNTCPSACIREASSGGDEGPFAESAEAWPHVRDGWAAEAAIQVRDLLGRPAHNATTTVIETLSLSNRGIRWLPKALGKLTNLRHLVLVNNHVDALPAEFSGLRGLEHLYLDGNRLTSLPETIGLMTRLRIVHVSDNRLTLLPTSIGRLNELTDLYANKNALVALPDGICDMPIERLHLSYNELEELPSRFGSGVPTAGPSRSRRRQAATSIRLSLLELGLRSNHLRCLPMELFECRRLELLHLQDNALDALPVSAGLLPSLVSFGTDRCPLKEFAKPVRLLFGGALLRWCREEGGRIVRRAVLEKTDRAARYGCTAVDGLAIVDSVLGFV